MKKMDTSVLIALIAGLSFAGTARAAKTTSMDSECKHLHGTAKIHCRIGSDPHTGPLPVEDGAVKEKTAEEKAKELQDEIKKVEQDLADLRESLYRPDSNESMEDAVSRVTDLSQEKKDILVQIEKLVGQRNALWEKEREMKKTERSGKLPADHDCTRKGGHRIR